MRQEEREDKILKRYNVILLCLPHSPFCLSSLLLSQTKAEGKLISPEQVQAVLYLLLKPVTVRPFGVHVRLRNNKQYY